MDTKVFNKRYRKLSIAALITGILAVALCMLYFLAWALFDDFLTSFIASHGFMTYIMFSYVFAGVCLTITSVITGSIDFKRLKKGDYSSKGRGFDITGIIIGSFLILFGFILWFVDFFGFINIIT